MTLVAPSLPGVRRAENLLGIPIVADVRDDGVGERDLDHVFDWFRWVEATFSTLDRDSEISRLNRGELDLGRAHPDVRRVLTRCDELRRDTIGYFDIRAAGSGSLDPFAFVKGWSVDHAATLLEEAGIRNYAISAGGDLRVSGRPAPDPKWLVSVQHPVAADRVAATVALASGAIATTGAYGRGRKIVDPHTGEPPLGVLSVTITGPELSTTHAYATAAFAMGEAGPRWVARLRGHEGLTMLVGDRMRATRGFRRAEPRPPS
jgi:thiamine biosynthesis lipoprotein